MTSARQVQTFQKQIWTYYHASGRNLPWRHTHNPYHILVSEVMLQQTQAARVLLKYKSFIKKYPSFHSLARAPLREILRTWQGLGYNRRAMYLKRLSNQVVRTFGKHIRGVPHAAFLQVARNVITFHQNQTYRYTRDLIKELRRKKYYLLAISSSPKEVVDEFAYPLGFNKVYGSIYELDAYHRFTGKIAFSDLVENKSKILRRAVDKEGLSWKSSVGVGDTETDISFLKLVERPIAFNPNRKLFQHASRAGWKIIVERKDVVYTFKHDTDKRERYS